MKLSFTGLHIPFSLENTNFYAHSLSFDKFSVPLPGHRHGGGCYEIHYVTAGYGLLKLGEERFKIVPNTLYVTGPHIYHEQIPDPSKPMEEYCVYLQTDGPEAPGPFVRQFLNTRRWFGQDTQDIGPLFEKLLLELDQKALGYREAAGALLSQLVIHLTRNYEYSRFGSAPPPALPVPSSMTLIAEKCFLFEYATITLEELARRLGISPRQTERFLKKEYSESFQQKKTHARMAAASSFLMNPALSITAISELLGYSSSEHFSHAFRKYYGVSPRSYRKQHDCTPGIQETFP